MERITSAGNALLKLVRRLNASGRERSESGKILLDGVHLLQAYAQNHGCAHATIVVSDSGMTNPEIAEAVMGSHATRVVCVEDALFSRISPVQTPSGVLAIVDKPHLQETGNESFWVVLDGIQDPGNLGSILRTSAASGATCAVLAPECADPWSPKALRGGMGAQFSLPLRENAVLAVALRGFHGRVIGITPHSGQSIFELPLLGPLALVFGSEGLGLRQDTLAAVALYASIPGSSVVESLNVSAAVAICCFERVRQQIVKKTE